MFSKFSVKKPYTVVVGVVLIIILGVVTFMNMTVDLLPNMNMPYAIVMTSYPGASPEAVEAAVTKPVEQAMATVSNIKNIQSSSSENASTVILEFDQTANMDSVTIEMRETLDQIKGYWPDAVANPIIMKLNPSMMPVLITAVSASGADAAKTSKLIKEQVLPEIESVEGVASVSTYGSIEETVEITVNEIKIQNLNDEVKAGLNQQFEEAGAALQEAKDQVARGKTALENGKASASGQLGEAEAQISVKAEELKQAQLEITEKKAQLNMGENQLSQTLLVVQTSKAALKTQLENLESLKIMESQLQTEYVQLSQKDPAKLTEEEQARLQELTVQLGMLQNYDASKAQLVEGIDKISEQEAQLQSQQSQLNAGKTELETLQDQLNAGALTLAQARGQLSSAQIEAAASISQGITQTAVGEAAIQQQETQMESAKDEAYANADMANILNADMVKTLLAAENFSMPAGYVNEEGFDYLVRIGEKFKSMEEIKELVLVDMEGIEPVRLADVADVELVNNTADTYAKINGESGMMFSVQKQTGYSTQDVSDRVLEKLKTLEKEDLGIQAVTLMDQGVYIDLIVNSVLQNLLYGAVLAVIILLIFLKSVRPTLVIACSIPISIMTALVAMYFTGVTLNIISLSGLALGVGMLVDNSIVVIENIYRMRNEEGATARQAAIEGARQVSGAIAASTFTTICVFAPIVFAEGITRQLFVDMGLTIAYSLLASLLIALTVVPMMSAGLLKKTENKESRVFVTVKEVYGKILAKALKLKVLVLLGALGLLVLSGVLAYSRGTEFMPQMESTEVSITLEMEKGSTMEETAAAADQIMEKVGDIEDIEDLGGMIGSTSMMGSGSNTDTAEFYGITKEHPKLNNEEIKNKIEEATKDIPGEITVNMSSMDMSALGSSGIVVQIKGKDLDKLQKIASEVKGIVEGIKGAQNVLDGTEDNKEEIRVNVDKTKAIVHGLTVAQVYQELYGRLSDAQSATALSTDTNDYDIYVVEEKNENMTREDVRNLVIKAKQQDGTVKEVKLSDIAAFEDASGLQAISRRDQSRYMSVTAEIAEDDNIGLVSNRVKKELKSYQVPEGYEVKMMGEDETINEAMTELFKMLALAILFMYLIMVAQFQSLRSPFIVMFTVPLAFTGGLFGLWVTGFAVSVIAMVGFVMLSGILGLSTMAIGVGMGSDMVQPMAIVTIGGLFYGTILTLFVVPCIFDLFHKREKARLIEEVSND